MNATVRNVLIGIALVGIATLGPVGTNAPAGEEKGKTGEVKLVPVKWKGYLEQVASHKKAKLIVVDAWATWCGPCMENFPHLVEMHHKYADKGLVAISLSLDEADKPKKVAEATAFLKSQNAVFTNLLLDETNDYSFEKFDITAIPAVFLYGPDGKEIRRFTLEDVNNQFTYDQVEKGVQDYLDGKPITGGTIYTKK
jgi:thiol-disulfide isomerase/thioredoxin